MKTRTGVLFWAGLAFGCANVLGLDDYEVTDQPASGGSSAGGSSGSQAGGSGPGGSGPGGSGPGGSGPGGSGPGGSGPGGSGPGGTDAGGSGPGGAGPGGTGAGGSGAGGTDAGGTSGVGGAPIGDLGGRCTTDGDCGAGLVCLTSTSTSLGGNGAPMGLCTAACSNGQPCPGDFLCVNYAAMGQPEQAYCLERCTFGPVGGSTIDPSKCHGREEFGCTPFDSSGTVTPGCSPACNKDSDCAPWFCDRSAGTCRPTPDTGLPVGSVCNPSNDQCRGACSNFGTASICVEGCVWGAAESCGFAGSPPADAFCLFSYSATSNNGGPGPGDSAACGKLCDCDAECAPSAGVICSPFNDANVETFLGRKGACGTDMTSGTIPTCG